MAELRPQNLTSMKRLEATSTEQMYADIGKLRGKVVLITGGASGIGARFSREAGKHGAKLVIGDLSDAGQSVVDEIKAAGGEAVFQRCDVTSFEDQLKLFKLAIETYKVIDVCIPCAGLGENDRLENELPKKDGEYQKPRMIQLQVNLIGVLYTVQLGLSYMKHNPSQDKALVLIASMAGYFGLPGGSIYCAAKHAINGLFKSLPPQAAIEGIRICQIAPFFTDTPIITKEVKFLLKGIKLAKIEDVVAAMLFSASSPESANRSFIIDPAGVFSHPYDATIEETNNIYDQLAFRTEMAMDVAAGLRKVDRALSAIGGLKVGVVIALLTPLAMIFGKK